MQQKTVKNKVHRSGFDLTYRNLFSNKGGEIVPVGVFEALPGDKFRFKLNDFMRTMPFESACFARIKQYFDVYFVPNRLLWDKFPAWIQQTGNKFYAASASTAVDNFSRQPYMTVGDIVNYLNQVQNPNLHFNIDEAGLDRDMTTAKLLEYLGYGHFYKDDDGMWKSSQNTSKIRNMFPLLAYQKIYQDKFRFKQWEESAPWTYNLDYVLKESNLHLTGYDTDAFKMTTNMFDMRYANYDKDMINGLLPSAQFGDEAIASPIINGPGAFVGKLAQILPKEQPGSSFYSGVGIVNDTKGGFHLANVPSIGSGSSSFPNPTQVVNQATFALDENGGGSGLSILSIRFAQALQKWKEVSLTADPDFASQIAAHWNVSVPQYAKDECLYIGGMSSMVNINEIPNQSISASAPARLGATGTSSSATTLKFKVPDGEYGTILVLCHVKPILDWDANLFTHPFMERSLATDYAIPEFDNIGMQALTSDVLNFTDNAEPNNAYPLGYAPRYFDYKTNIDLIHGDMINLKSWTLRHQAPNQTVSGKQVLDDAFFRIIPSVFDSVFLPEAGGNSVTASGSVDSDLFRHSFLMDVKCVRNLSYDGMPY